MSQECLVSVIVPVYNSKRYVRTCLDSLLAQTLKEIEIIVVDDGSTDGSSDVLDEYAGSHSNIKVIHQSNQGQGLARNAGVSVAKGKYIGFVDSDDYVDCSMYEKLYSLITGADADVAVCKANSVDMNGVVGKPLDIWNKYGHAVLDRETFLENDFLNNGCSPVLWDKLIKGDIVKSHPSTDLRRGQDFIALIDYMSEVRRIAFMSDKLYYYRHHPNSVMATPESEEVILTDFRTEKVAVSKIKSYFSCTALEKSYIDRIVLEWESRLRNYSHLKEIKEFIERLKS